MATITTAVYKDTFSGWQIKIKDLKTTGKLKDNPLKLNTDHKSRTCNFKGCTNSIRFNRHSGLCDIHQTHQHDLLLEVEHSGHLLTSIPAHTEIIDQLMSWASTRNYNLTPLFSALSFNILGNIPDVSTLSGDIVHSGFKPPLLKDLLDKSISIIDVFLPETNNSSYQPLRTSKGDIPARVLAIVFTGLLVCEEANRGDRWFWRRIKNKEENTQMLGGAMALAYFAAKSFSWGVELGKAASKLTPRP